MGSHHFSITALDTDADTVAAALTRWMAAKGFASNPDPGLLDPEHERGFVLVPSGRHTVVLPSDLGELQRLRYELARDGTALEYYLFDSDEWGYALYDRGRAVSGFQSMDDPDDPPPAGNDLTALAEAFGVPGEREALAAAQRGRAVFAERVASPFLARLGIGPAGDSYAYARETALPPGARHLAFRREGWDPTAGVDLGRLRFRAQPLPAGREEIEARLAASATRWTAFSWVVWALFLPLALPLRLWFSWRGPPDFARGLVPEPKPPPWREEDGEWVHAAHGWRVRPAAGVTAGPVHGPVTFSWRLAGAQGSLRPVPASQLDALGQGPMGAEVAADETTVDGRPARRVTFVGPGFGGVPGTWLRRVIWVGPRAVWVADVMGQGEPAPDSIAAFDETLASLRSDGR